MSSSQTRYQRWKQYPVWYWALRYLATRADNDYPVPEDYQDTIGYLEVNEFIECDGDTITVTRTGELAIQRMYASGLTYNSVCSAHDDYVLSLWSEGND